MTHPSSRGYAIYALPRSVREGSKSLLVEPGIHLLDLVDYIHLNPARAGLAQAERLRSYRWTSLRHFPKIRSRPAFLDACWMDYADGLSDSRAGWNRYMKRLEMRASDDPETIDRIERRMNRGWCIGGRSFKRAVSGDLLEKEGAMPNS